MNHFEPIFDWDMAASSKVEEKPVSGTISKEESKEDIKETKESKKTQDTIETQEEIDLENIPVERPDSGTHTLEQYQSKFKMDTTDFHHKRKVYKKTISVSVLPGK